MNQISEHVWVYPFEEDKDRPNIGYIRDHKLAVAVEAGHSAAHVQEFYDDLERNHLPLPDMTVVTHWHWDHTFAMHAVHGITIAEERTSRHLQEIVDQMHPAYQEEMMNMDLFISKEYNNQKMIVVPPDIIFKDKLEIHSEDFSLQMMHVPSPHTDDSVVILAEEDKVLFIGDAVSGLYPDYGHPDHHLLSEFKQAVSELNFSICVGGHWPVQTKEELMKEI